MIDAMGATDLNDFSVPKQTVFGLVARSVGNLQGVDLLLRAERIVEARTITRCLVENLVLLASIYARPDRTLEELQRDFVKSRVVRADILAKGGSDVIEPEQLARLQAFASDLRGRHPKTSYLNQTRLAADTFAEGAMATYSLLSDDAAHATVASLARHILLQQSGARELIPYPEPSVSEACHTAATATNMTLGLLLGSRDIFGNALGEQDILKLHTELSAVKARWPPRPGTLDPT
ncbi:DUF5677 domain-containing protein [Neoroseomonas terrae]|nr:DUF5677 domain-containing protein [Neoroseomonas terrae]